MRRIKDNYPLINAEIDQFKNEGYLVLKNVLTEEELESIDGVFDFMISGSMAEEMRKDFCDMSQPYGTAIENFQLVNAMLPSHYVPSFKGNIFQRVSQNIATQLYKSDKASIDYEQFLAKKPSKSKAEFAMHQDLGYWPKTKNTWTATFSLALSDADVINGCLHVVPGSNREPHLRKHIPKAYGNNTGDGSREESHTLIIEQKPSDSLIYLPVKRGDVTIHDERIVHGSSGNNSSQWRKTYIIAYRDVETIRVERAMGFTHSHNDEVDWDQVIN